jgi:hypothetical protein
MKLLYLALWNVRRREWDDEALWDGCRKCLEQQGIGAPPPASPSGGKAGARGFPPRQRVPHARLGNLRDNRESQSSN